MISHAQRWKFAFRAFFSLIFHGRIAEDILAAFVPPPAAPASEPAPAPTPATTPPRAAVAVSAADAAEGDHRAVQVLMLLQRGGRLIDFLMEDLTGYLDAQIGAAVRDVHKGCRETLARYVTLAPVLAEDEGARVRLDRGSDPATIKFVGNLGATPLYEGVVRHRGWEATRVELPPLPATGRTIVAPAEVEVG